MRNFDRSGEVDNVTGISQDQDTEEHKLETKLP